MVWIPCYPEPPIQPICINITKGACPDTGVQYTEGIPNAAMPKYGVFCLTSMCHHGIRHKHTGTNGACSNKPQIRLICPYMVRYIWLKVFSHGARPTPLGNSFPMRDVHLFWTHANINTDSFNNACVSRHPSCLKRP